MATETNNMKEVTGPILHVIVVGFHHKKGCQVEYSFPPLIEGSPPDSSTCPPGWKYLPTLALPDGSHNFDEDTVYFHLPSLTNPKETVYGISCFRQIPVERLKARTSDITRGTVQKSVCVLSQLPLFGHIQVKMALITHAYFAEGDFSKVSLLHDTYHHLNGCLATTPPLTTNPPPPQLFVGLSARDLVLQFRHKALLLFKLLLLERRIVFYRSPVQPLCTAILSLLSLHPGMLEAGLSESACVRPSRPMSPIPDFCEDGDSVEESLAQNGAHLQTPGEEVSSGSSTVAGTPKEECDRVSPCTEETPAEVDENENSQNSTWYDREGDAKLPVSDSLSSLLLQRDQAGIQGNTAHIDQTGAGNVAAAAHVDSRLCGTPLPVFTQGYLCHPYLSLPYLDLLSDVNVRGYVVGATNVLFKQKKQLADVLVEVESAKVETQEPELRRLLHLTTEDLRFADYVVRQVSEDRHDVFLDGVGWEGGDEWIRAQFRAYLLCLLRTSLLQDGSREIEHFNASFMSAWKDTHNYKMWVSSDHSAIWDVNPGHPFAGQLSVSDMKLRLSHTMQNTEGGRKLNQAMASTGRAVATTGRAVGGALSQARGALSSWWSTLTTAPPGGSTAASSASDEGEGICEGSTGAVDEAADALQTPGSATDMHRSPTVEQPAPSTTTVN
ncbi:late secretory pathway protein AVL9 homolog [Schistocerca piceifrons]|uniref:late secretory pathway protein AVL9 homolog n=1 Tax=Schistocerca piceifrons TaxID=274613 RepID=UPI001F5E5F16|nr:late secretory pathway protein AVL9 homolog [Schistocerca piceifrons]